MRHLPTRAAAAAAAVAAATGVLAVLPQPGPASAADGHGLQVVASDVVLDGGYWDGGTESALTIEVRNTGAQREEVEGSVFLPPGTRPVGQAATAGCAAGSGTGFTCAVEPGEPPGRVTLRLVVEPDAWLSAPLAGTATASAPASGVADSDGFTVVVPAGPPGAGVSLATADVVLPQAPDGVVAGQQLEVRLTPREPATGAVEVVTPPGVTVQRLPGACRSGSSRVAVNRERCELGPLPAGQELVLTFGLQISPQAVAEAPLGGAILCRLGQPDPSGSATAVPGRPAGRDRDGPSPGGSPAPAAQVTAQVSFLVRPDAAASASPSTPASASEAATGAGAWDGPAPGFAAPTVATPISVGGDGFAGRVPVSLVIAVAGGLVAVVGFLVLASLRRRMRDEPIITTLPPFGGGE